MSTHNLGVFSYEEKLTENDEEYQTNGSESTGSESEDSEFQEQEELARTQQLHLQERFLILQRTLNDLRSQLCEEREMWRREAEEINSCTIGKCCEAHGDFKINRSLDSLKNSSVHLDLDYSYSTDLYNERKRELQRQIAYSNFQRRLLEVENMCNLELLRVKQSAQCLEPLRVMVSEWNKSYESSGDGDGHFLDNNDAKQVEEQKKPKEINGAIELIGSKLYKEINEMFNKVISPGTWQTSSEESTVSNASTTAIYISDDSQNSNN